MSDTLVLVQLTADEHQAVRELPAILRDLKARLAAVLKPRPSPPVDGKQLLSFGEARKLAGCNAMRIFDALNRHEIEGAVKKDRGRVGVWKIPRASVLAWIKRQA
jgi:hypothetical protein